MYVITGATGNTGSTIAKELLAKGKEVRAIGRNAGKLKELETMGAEVFVGNMADADFLRQAYNGANAAFIIVPPDPHSDDFRTYQRQIARNHAEAVGSSSISHVILLSSIGAHMRNGAGVVDGLGYLEELFLAMDGVNVLNLRPSYFMENLFGQIPAIRQMGIIGSPLRGDLSLPMVATKDIAALAAARLLSLNFTGNETQYVLGPADVTMNQVAAELSRALNMPNLSYVEFSPEDAKNALVGSGYISANVAEMYNELSAAMNSGEALSAHSRTPENTTSTSLAEFSRVFAQVYNQG